MRVWRILAVLAFAFVVSTAPVTAQPTVGTVKSVRGSCVVKRGGATLPATEGMHLLEEDVLETGIDGYLGIMLNDETRISIGSRTETSIDQFTFDPGQGQLGLVLRMLRGVMVYVSGKIEELSPQAVRLETPVGILGLRGTRVAIALEQP